MSRVALSLEVLEVVERATFTDEALCAETSRYIDSLSFFMGGRDLSSSTPSGFDRVVEKGGLSVGWPLWMVERSRTR